MRTHNWEKTIWDGSNVFSFPSIICAHCGTVIAFLRPMELMEPSLEVVARARGIGPDCDFVLVSRVMTS